MLQFVNGNDTQFNWLRNQIQESLYIFKDVPLPNTCTPNIARIGFEYTQANGYKMYIDKNISFLGSHVGFKALLLNGEASFSSYDSMVTFLRGLGSLYNIGLNSNLNFFNMHQPLNDHSTLNYSVNSLRGRKDFTFKYEKIGTIWRAFIVNSPSYGSRATGLHDTHRLTDNGRYYVCWTPEPTRLDDITQVSKLWAEATAKYIDTGRFPTG